MKQHAGQGHGTALLLHGYGADGSDLLPLAEKLGALAARFIAPDAPEPHELGGGRQWFDLSWYNNDTLTEAETLQRLNHGVQHAAPHLKKLLESTRPRVLIGFSQGAMLALYAALHQQHELEFDAVIAFSGVLTHHHFEPIRKTPTLLIHGADDPLIPSRASTAAQPWLQAHNIPHQCHILPGLEHGIDERALQLALDFAPPHHDRIQSS